MNAVNLGLTHTSSAWIREMLQSGPDSAKSQELREKVRMETAEVYQIKRVSFDELPTMVDLESAGAKIWLEKRLKRGY